MEWRSQVEEGISLCSSAVSENDRNESLRKRVWAGEMVTQAKCLMWITVGQTSEEDKTANMSHCSLLAFNNRCLVSPSLVTLLHSGWSDPLNETRCVICRYINIYFCQFSFMLSVHSLQCSATLPLSVCNHSLATAVYAVGMALLLIWSKFMGAGDSGF